MLIETYWKIGKTIVEGEQGGKTKANYGEGTLKTLATQLTIEFGMGFDESNLRNMRSFYKAFPIRDALRHELSWTHYRLLTPMTYKDYDKLKQIEAAIQAFNSQKTIRMQFGFIQGFRL